MSPIPYRSADEVQEAVLRHLLSDAAPVSPRGIPTVESQALSFVLTNPRARCITNPERKWSLPLALGELSWHLSGSTDASPLVHYSRAWRAFADNDGQIRGSCYGSKAFSRQEGQSPWRRAGNLLCADPATRRAVIYFNDPSAHLDVDCRDAACATSLQFMIRSGALDAVACMRSNDAIWGLPYDLFLFTFLQEMMSVELAVKLGSYYHFAGSLHVYERHRALARRILDAPPTRAFIMPPLLAPQMASGFVADEKRIRERGEAIEELDDYWRELLRVLQLFGQSQHCGWARVLSTASTPYLPVLEPLGLTAMLSN